MTEDGGYITATQITLAGTLVITIFILDCIPTKKKIMSSVFDICRCFYFAR